MPSAQVLPNGAASTAKKQELLAAGKRRLEEFRRKKALEKEKNAAPARHLQVVNDNQSAQITEVQPADPDEVGPSSRTDGTKDESLVVTSSRGEVVQASQIDDQGSSNELSSVPPPFNKGIFNPKEDYKVNGIDKEVFEESGISDRQHRRYTNSEINYFHEPTSHEKDNVSSKVDKYSSLSSSHPDNSHNFTTAADPVGSGTSVRDRKVGSSFSFLSSPYSAPSATSETHSSSFESSTSYSDYALTGSAKSKTSIGRSRPSFLDSIKVSSPTPFPLPVERKEISSDISNSPAISNLSKEPKVVDALGSYSSSRTANAFEKSHDLPISANNGSHLFNSFSNGNLSEYENPYHSVKQNEDFSALEQHIEDLTQEKFSLQRAVEASRALAESLAVENSALTDSYNQQGSVVNQLKFEMEKLQEEIRGQAAELEAVKSEYGNVLLECNAADERAKLLASEVISLEEKALRLRSNELKLERQLETALSEVSSLKKKISNLEKEREDLQSSVAAFQEEKRMLQSKLRKMSSNEIPVVKPSDKKNASTSTDDLVYQDNVDQDGTADSSDTIMLGAESSSEIGGRNCTRFPENSQVNLQVGSISIPDDQMGVIQNINALLSELALEKEELIRTLKAESSECSKIKELNKELSKRLEIQTQRLELLTSQSMAGDNNPTRQPEFPSVNNPVIYADEGDEVVERVLGWIMKLFPGGPSKRRTSKLI